MAEWSSRAIGFAMLVLSMVNCQAQEAQKKMQILIQQVLDKKPIGRSTAQGRSAPGANPELITLTRNDDADVRRVAVYCLNETGGRGCRNRPGAADARSGRAGPCGGAGGAPPPCPRYRPANPVPGFRSESRAHGCASSSCWSRRRFRSVTTAEIQKRYEPERIRRRKRD